MLLDMDDEFTLNQSATLEGQLITATAIGGRVKDCQGGAPGPAATVATFGTAAAPLTFRRRDWATGDVVWAYFKVTAAAAANPTTNFVCDIIAADNADLVTTMTGFNGVTVSNAPVVLATTTVLTAALTAGSIHDIGALQPGTLRRYLGCKFTATGGSATTGAEVCGLINRNARAQSWVGTDL
jgi:hypothetical protein